MTIGILVFGAVFLTGLALGTITHRPFATACVVVASFVSLLLLEGHDPFVAFAAFSLISLAALLADAVRETVGLLLGRG